MHTSDQNVGEVVELLIASTTDFACFRLHCASFAYTHPVRFCYQCAHSPCFRAFVCALLWALLHCASFRKSSVPWNAVDFFYFAVPLQVATWNVSTRSGMLVCVVFLIRGTMHASTYVHVALNVIRMELKWEWEEITKSTRFELNALAAISHFFPFILFTLFTHSLACTPWNTFTICTHMCIALNGEMPSVRLPHLHFQSH